MRDSSSTTTTRAERLDDVALYARGQGSLDEVGLAERRQQHDRGDAVRGQGLGGRHPIQDGHLDVHEDDIRAHLADQPHAGLPVPGLSRPTS